MLVVGSNATSIGTRSLRKLEYLHPYAVENNIGDGTGKRMREGGREGERGVREGGR